MNFGEMSIEVSVQYPKPPSKNRRDLYQVEENSYVPNMTNVSWVTHEGEEICREVKIWKQMESGRDELKGEP